jgi:rhodanese-related sulfurtransferase
MEGGEAIRVIDVREPWEYDVCRLEGAELIPMGDVPAALPRLEGEEAPLVVYCHHGVRSLRVANWLRQQGVEQVWSLAGGIDRWSEEIDPKVPRYT